MKIKLLRLLFIGGLLFSTCCSFAQNVFEVGVGLGPVIPFYNFSNENRAEKFSYGNPLGVHVSAIGRYLFKNKMGLETGIVLTAQNHKIRVDGFKEKTKILADSYTIPFLFVYKINPPSNPFMDINLLFGPLIEFPVYIPIFSDHLGYDVEILNRKKTTVSFAVACRLARHKKPLKNTEIGFSFVYRLQPAYTFHILNTDLFLDPKVYSLKLEILYFFWKSPRI